MTADVRDDGRPRVDPGKRALGSGGLVVALGGLVAIGASVVLITRGLTQPHAALAFGALVAVGELARIGLPGEREGAPVATAAGLAYALVPSIGPAPAVHGAFQVITVAAVGVCVGAVPHAAVGRPLRADGMARRVLTVAVAALLFRPFLGVLSPVYAHTWLLVGVLVSVLLVAGLADMVLAAFIRTNSGPGYMRGLSLARVHTGGPNGAGRLGRPGGSRLRQALRDEFRVRLPLSGSTLASALLVAMAAHVMAWSALVVCVIPLVVTQVAYRRYAGIRATYLQTIRALARIPEVGGYVESGHSRRVSRLAVRMGRDLGLSERRLLDLEYAALMHDIGQLSLRDPKPGGATVHASYEEQESIAARGADVIRQTGVLDRVADIVASHAKPYGAAGAPPGSDAHDERPPPESRIIRVANAYDDLAGDVADSSHVRAALYRIRLDTAREYDPRVVRALACLVEPAAADPTGMSNRQRAGHEQ